MILDSLPAAIGIAISPLPIIAILLMLMSKRAKGNSIAFALGWVMTLTAISFIVLGLAEGGDVGHKAEPNRVAATIQLGLGALLLLLAFKDWQKRPRPGQKATMPKWLQSIDKLKPGGAFGLAVGLCAVNPKNLPLAIAGMLTIAEADASHTVTYTTVVVFITIGSLTLVAPVLYNLIAQKQATKVFTRMKGWLAQNNAVIMAILFLVLGIKICYEASMKIWG